MDIRKRSDRKQGGLQKNVPMSTTTRYFGKTDDDELGQRLAANPRASDDALATQAGIFADVRTLMVVNLRASSCIPADMVCPKQNPMLEHVIASFLPSLLYCGFVKYFIESEPGGSARTVRAAAEIGFSYAAADAVAVWHGIERHLLFSCPLWHD